MNEEIDTSKISPRIDLNKLGDLSKYDFIPGNDGLIPVAKSTPVGERMGQLFKERIIEKPTNPIGAAVRGARDALSGASTVLGSIEPAIGMYTAQNPEEEEYRKNQLVKKWGNPGTDQTVIPSKNVVKTNVGKTANPSEMEDPGGVAKNPANQSATAEDPMKSYLRSIGYDVNSPAFKQMEDNFKNYKAAQVADANAQADVYLETRKALERSEAERQVSAANFNQKTQESIRKYESLNEEFLKQTMEAPSRQEVENKYWANKSSKSRIFGLLSLGFGNASTWNNYNKAIDSELDSQMAKLKMIDKGISNQQTLVGMNRDIAKDDGDARLMAKNSMMN